MKKVDQTTLMVGNYINVSGTFQIVLGIVYREERSDFYIQHTGQSQEDMLIPEGIEFSPSGIQYTQEWKEWLNVDKLDFPKHIEYVHEIQNYMLFKYGVNLMENVDYGSTPKIS